MTLFMSLQKNPFNLFGISMGGFAGGDTTGFGGPRATISEQGEYLRQVLLEYVNYK